MAISGIFGRNNISGLKFTIELPQEIFAGTSVPVKVTIENRRKFLPAFLIRLHADRFAAFFPFVGRRDSASVYVHITFDKRGLHSIRDVRISSVFPFNFFTRFKVIHQTVTCVVFPKLKSQGSCISLQEKASRTGDWTSEITGIDSDILSIREYVRGDPLKYIHWKASARTGRLKTKELSSSANQPVIIDFENIAIQDLEDRISFAAYTIVNLLKRNKPVGLRMRNAFHKPGISNQHRIAMLRQLALDGSDSHITGENHA